MTPAARLAQEVDLLLDEPLPPEAKGVPPDGPLTLRELGARGLNVLDGDLILPVMVLKESALAHNIAVMADWCAGRGVLLAPHGKTTMAPQLYARQLEAGAWAITAATIGQVRVMRAFGVPRVLMANELVQPAGLRWLAAELAADPGFEALCLVDGLAGVARMEEALAGAPDPARPVAVLVELSRPGARTGARSAETARAVARAVGESAALELAGVEGYEGSIAHDRTPEALARVRAHLREVAELARALDGEGAFSGREEVVVSAGGSVFFDEVADALAGLELSKPTRVVLRSGCYLTHDHAHYARLSPLGDRLRPALELWAEVISLPEDGLAILCFGKRDAPYDLELPIPLAVRRRAGALEPLEPGRLTVHDTDDQHAYVDVDGVTLEVGDLVGLGISHPCTAFDKWRLLPLVDDDYRVTGGVRTFF